MRRLRFRVGQDDRGRPIVKIDVKPPAHRDLSVLTARQRAVEASIERDAVRARAQRIEAGLLRRRPPPPRPPEGRVTLRWARARLDHLMQRGAPR